MKAYKIEVLVIDHQNLGLDAVVCELANVKHLWSQVVKTKEAEIGAWCDEHPLNHRETFKATLAKLFDE